MTRAYRLGPRIGQGGMAEVFLAVQCGPAQFAKLVVQKRVRGEVSSRPDLGRGFLLEARLLARLSHPNLVQVLDLGWDERGPFVVVEYLSGETLSAILRELWSTGRGMPWPIAVKMTAGLAAGLAAAHEATDPAGRPDPILHRDLTPSNVIVCTSGAVKIIDFGIAKLAARTGDTMAGAVKGKLSYLAPELLRGRPASRASDLFQLGVLFFEALTCRRLFDAPSDAARIRAVFDRAIPRPSAFAAGLPAAVDRIALGLLARDPLERTGDADQVRRDLEEVLRQSGAQVSDLAIGRWLEEAMPRQLAERLQRERDCLRQLVGPPVETPAPRWRRRAFTAAALCLAVAAGVGGRAIWPEDAAGADAGGPSVVGPGDAAGGPGVVGPRLEVTPLPSVPEVEARPGVPGVEARPGVPGVEARLPSTSPRSTDLAPRVRGPARRREPARRTRRDRPGSESRLRGHSEKPITDNIDPWR